MGKIGEVLDQAYAFASQSGGDLERAKSIVLILVEISANLRNALLSNSPVSQRKALESVHEFCEEALPLSELEPQDEGATIDEFMMSIQSRVAILEAAVFAAPDDEPTESIPVPAQEKSRSTGEGERLGR